MVMEFVGFLIKYFAVLEADFPVNATHWRNVHLWPLARAFLYTQMKRKSLFVAEEVAEGWLAPTHPWRAFMLAVERRFQTAIGDDPPAMTQNVEPRQLVSGPSLPGGPAIFLSAAEHHSAQGRRGPRAPVIDPWIDAIAGIMPTLKLEMASDAVVHPQGRDHASVLVPSWTRETLVARGLDEDVTAFLAAFTGYCEALRRHTVERYGFDIGPLLFPDARQYAYLTILRRHMFAELFETLRPSLAFCQTYYEPSRLGLIWAAADAGCPSADLQHGLNGWYHCAYSHWTAVPPTGYALLPDAFVVWDAESAANIARWMPPERRRNRVWIGGQPDDAPLASTVRAGIGLLQERSAAAERTILVTLSPAECMQYGLPDLLLDTIRRTPPEWLWLIRSHPRLPPDDRFGHRGIAATLERAGIRNFDSRLATEVPLDAAIAASTHHLTQFSTCFLRCLDAGVPTTFIHPLCLQHFHHHVTEGIASLETTVDGIRDRIVRGWAGLHRPPRPSPVVATPERTRALVATLLTGNGGDQGPHRRQIEDR